MKFFMQSYTSMYVVPLLISLVIFCSACSSNDDSHENGAINSESARQNHAFATVVEEAHKMSNWNKKGSLKTEFELNFGGSPMNANLYVETGGPGIRFELSDDTLAIFDGNEMYAMPSDSVINPFTLKTWAYFLEAPYKLNDPGTKIETLNTAAMQGTTFDRARLTFESGIGDTPDDWYIIYRNQDNGRLQAMAYIVTAGKTVEEANEDPHAISYQNFKMIDGIPVATTWKFWGWDEKNGFSDEPLGEATLSNVEFMSTDTLFTPPDGAKRMKR